VNKKAILALMLAILLPLVSYWIVEYYSTRAVSMPHRYFYDSVSVIKKNGKQSFDTIWHKVKGPVFTNQFGKEVSLADIKNRAIVINFFFTKCPSICPALTKSMKKLQYSFRGNNDTLVQFISVSVDPEHDSTEALRKYADKFKINHDSWWFVRADKKETYEFALQEMKASIADSGVDTAFIHTENFFLLDSRHVIRGWYNGFDTLKMARLASDIPLLMLEKDKTQPSIFALFIPILPIIFIGIGIVFIIMIFLEQKRKKENNE